MVRSLVSVFLGERLLLLPTAIDLILKSFDSRGAGFTAEW
jgi:hypothetical protein